MEIAFATLDQQEPERWNPSKIIHGILCYFRTLNKKTPSQSLIQRSTRWSTSAVSHLHQRLLISPWIIIIGVRTEYHLRAVCFPNSGQSFNLSKYIAAE